jgi:hypothetical protein
MSCLCMPRYSAYTAVVLNRLRGRRARCGNANPPCNLGDWFADMPRASRLRILDASDRPVPDGTAVKLFYDSGGGYTSHRFEQSNSRTLQTAGGVVSLGADPFHDLGSNEQAARHLLLIEVQAANDYFCFQEPTSFNLASWFGYVDASHPALFTLRLGQIRDNDCNLQLPPARVNEPFATSPYRSRIAFDPRSGSLQVRLLDDDTPPHAMKNRLVQVRKPNGRVVASGLTNAQGTVLLRLPRPLDSYQLVDVTDNELRL